VLGLAWLLEVELVNWFSPAICFITSIRRMSAHDRWRWHAQKNNGTKNVRPKTHPQVHFHFIPTHSSWLNQVECWFSILSRGALQGSSFTSVPMLVQAIEAFSRWNQNAAPFEWTKHEVHQQR
jgi:transposase